MIRSNPTLARGRELQRQRRHNLAALVAVAVLLTPLVIGMAWVMSSVARSSAEDADVVVEVLPGWTTVEVGDTLQSAGVIDSSTRFQEIATTANFTAFAAGRYVFVSSSSEREALDTLRGGPARIVPDYELLLPPGITLNGIAQRVGELPGKSAERFLEVARSGVIRSRYQPETVASLEGLTWPDTYFIGANETEEQILQRIVTEFDDRADAIGLANADATGMSPYDTLIAASLIQTESGRDEDAPIISSVIRNRLFLGMQLQIDATLCYAKGGCPPVPVDADRRIDSPYNTYKIAGLPPTPIATVGEKAIRAALNPSGDGYLFYVADKNGVSYFATTQAEHERNIAKARNVD